MFRDINDRQLAHFDLRHERDRARQYLDIAEVILLELDRDGRIVLVNRYACSVLGWEESELIGRDWIETCLPTRTQQPLKEKFAKLIAGDLSVVENPVLTKFGEERLVEWRNRLVRDEQGQVLGTLSSGTDITDRQRATQALGIAEERMRFALDAAEVGIWDMNYKSGVLHWSEILKSQFGLPPSSFGGTFEEFVERIHPDDRPLALASIDEATKSGRDFSILHRVIWPDGTVRWLRGAGRILRGKDGQPIRGIGISQDFTERKHAEDEFKRLNEEIYLQRLKVFKATMRTVQDIVNNFLNASQLIRFEAEGLISRELETTFDCLIQETAMRLNTLAALDTIVERKMAAGPGIDFPGFSS